MMQPGLEQAILDRSGQLRLSIPSGALQSLVRYYQLLARWNRRINLTGLELEGHPAGALDRLILEPLVAANSLGLDAGRWFDIGSGGGLPAIPIRLICPALRLTMVEPKGRKVAFLREAIRTLQLDHVDVVPRLVEDLGQEFHMVADLVTIRAVRIDELVGAGLRALLKPAGRLISFGAQSRGLDGFEAIQDLPLPGSSTLRFYRRI